MKQIGHMIYADAGKVLRSNWDGQIYGSEVGLGYVYYDLDGERLVPPLLLTADNFTEEDDPTIGEITPESLGLEEGFTYAQAKAAIVKTHYSYDDQIALMLNYAEQPEAYEQAYQEMQSWRKVAGEIAKRLTGEEHLQMIVACLNYSEGSTEWEVGDISVVDDSEKLVSYENVYLIDALKLVAEAYDTEYIIESKKIHLHRVDTHRTSPLTMQYGRSNGFLSGVARRNDNSLPPVDILYVQGGEHNIDPKTYGNTTLLLPNIKDCTVYYDGINMYVETALTDPSTKQRVWYDARGQRMSGIPAVGLAWLYKVSSDRLSLRRINADGSYFRNTGVEGVYDGSEIYPKRIGTVSLVGTEAATTTDTGEPYTLYNIYDADFGNTKDTSPTPNYIDLGIENETMTVVFQDGMLAGREFSIQTSGSGVNVRPIMKFDDNVMMWFLPLCPSEEDNMIMPNPTFAPAVGDHYVVFHSALPESYIREAEYAILNAAVDWLYHHDEQAYSFNGDVDRMFLKNNATAFARMQCGEHIRLKDAQLFGPSGLTMRITSLQQNINDPYSFNLTLDNTTKRMFDWTKRLIQAVREQTTTPPILRPNQYAKPQFRPYVRVLHTGNKAASTTRTLNLGDMGRLITTESNVSSQKTRIEAAEHTLSEHTSKIVSNRTNLSAVSTKLQKVYNGARNLAGAKLRSGTSGNQYQGVTLAFNILISDLKAKGYDIGSIETDIISALSCFDMSDPNDAIPKTCTSEIVDIEVPDSFPDVN